MQRRKDRKIKFEINTKAKGKARPRFRRIGKYVNTYTPKTTVEYENLVKEAFKKKAGRTIILLDSDIEVSVKIIAYFSPPKSISKKLRLNLIENRIGYLKKPDGDNIAKAICDALNGIAYKDDNQITKLEVQKLYGEEDKVLVEIEYL